MFERFAQRYFVVAGILDTIQWCPMRGEWYDRQIRREKLLISMVPR
jgi:hypothetical protein